MSDDTDVRTFELDGLAAPAPARRGRLVAWACGWLTVLQTLPYVAVGWITDGGTAAGDGALYALSPSALLGVVGFGIVLAVALTSQGLQPSVERGRGGGGPGGGAGAGVGDAGGAGASGGVGPLLPTRPSRLTVLPGSVLRRVGWAALAALAEAVVFAGAFLLDDAASVGAVAVGGALDDGTALLVYFSTVLQVLLMDLRAPLAVAVALVVLTRARRPVSPTVGRPVRAVRRRGVRSGAAARPVAPPAARSTRRSPNRPPS